FPVVGQEDSYLGMVFLDDVKTLIFRPELYNKIYVRELMFQPPCTADISETMDQIAHKFLQIPDYNIPILDGKTYIGFVSRANVFSNYRKKVKEMSND
ncbi:MAG: chloride channel protein, partial [Bacteroidales bacterium]